MSSSSAEPDLFLIIGETPVVAQDIAEVLLQVRPKARVLTLERQSAAHWARSDPSVRIAMLIANMRPADLMATGLPERASRVVLLSDEADGVAQDQGWALMLRPFVSEDLARLIPSGDAGS